MRILYILFIFTTFVSCNEKKVDATLTSIEEGIDVNVLYSAGEKWDDDRYLPLPFNVAYRGLDTFMIIGNSIKKGKVAHVRPLGVARIKSGDNNIDYIITIPNDAGDEDFKANDFMELSTIHSSVLWIIEQYLINHRGERNNTSFISWNDERQVEKLLLDQ